MAGKRRSGSRSGSRSRSRGGKSSGGIGVTTVGVLLGLFLLGGLANGTITVPGADPNSPFQLPDFDWLTPNTTPTAQPVATPVPQAPTPYDAALTQLETLTVKGRASKTGYTRDQFGPAWKDVDGNSIDTRNDILIRDLTGVVFKDAPTNHVVASGTLNDVYTGTTINFVRGQDTSSAVQIDHRVALSNAWQTGAQGWDQAKREQFANDPANLIAVDGPTNSQKGDGDAATWLPPNKAYRCQYVSAQVQVKATYELWVTPAEHDAIKDILESCN